MLSDDEIVLKELTMQVSEATNRASKSLDKGIKDAESVLAELRVVH